VRKLKIGYFIDAWNPGAGTENQLLGILQHLDPSEVDARLFTLREPIPEQHCKDIPWPVECLGVSSLLSLNGVVRFFQLVRRLRRERFDIAMIYFIDSNLFVTPACRLAGIKASVVNRRDMGYWYEPGILGKLNRVNKYTNYFLVNSRAVKEAVIANEHFPAERIEVIYNGLWETKKPALPPFQRSDFNLPSDGPLIGIVANLRPVKRVDRFIEMAAKVVVKIPSAHFVIAGRGELKQDLNQQVARLNLSERVHFLGPVAEVERLLPLLDVGVLTSESEGFSNALIEYVSAGVPAVTFAVGGNPEIVRDGVNGRLAPDGDVERLADAVSALLSDDAQRLRMAQAGRQSAARDYDPAEIMRQTIAFYRTIVEAPRNQARFA
jgi:glycosyltransferase involved in cell wall biosynthesis